MSRRMQEVMIEADDQKVIRCKSCHSPNTEIIFDGPDDRPKGYTLRLTTPHSWLKCKDCQNLSVHETMPTGSSTGGEITWFSFQTTYTNEVWDQLNSQDHILGEPSGGNGRRK